MTLEEIGKKLTNFVKLDGKFIGFNSTKRRELLPMVKKRPPSTSLDIPPYPTSPEYPPAPPEQEQEYSPTKPAHYLTCFKYDPITIAQDWNLSFSLGSVLKYIARAGKKPDETAIQALEKAQEFLTREIAWLQSSLITDGMSQLNLKFDEPAGSSDAAYKDARPAV